MSRKRRRPDGAPYTSSMSKALKRTALTVSHKFRGVAPQPVDPDVLADAVSQPVGAGGRAFPDIFPDLIADNYPQAFFPAFYNPVDQCLAALPGGVEVYQFPLVLRPKGAGNGQQIDRLQEGGLAPGVRAEVHRNAGQHFQVHFGQIAKVGQPEAGEVCQPLLCLPGPSKVPFPGGGVSSREGLLLRVQLPDHFFQLPGLAGVASGETETPVQV